MTGERMNKIYAQICLNEKPDLKTDEERRFYNSLVKEMRAEEKASPKRIQWAIPSE